MLPLSPVRGVNVRVQRKAVNSEYLRSVGRGEKAKKEGEAFLIGGMPAALAFVL